MKELEPTLFKWMTFLIAFVPPKPRFSEVESGSSVFALEIPYKEYNRIIKSKGPGGNASPVPDIGNLAIGAVVRRDRPLIQRLVLTLAVLFIGINLAADATHAWLNPGSAQDDASVDAMTAVRFGSNQVSARCNNAMAPVYHRCNTEWSPTTR